MAFIEEHGIRIIGLRERSRTDIAAAKVNIPARAVWRQSLSDDIVLAQGYLIL